MIQAIPTTYNGVRFRSKLEADWAATLDHYEIKWSYEPEAIRLSDGEAYLPDFWLPEIATWLEVKGPHWERVGKTIKFAGDILGDDPFSPDQMVVVGEAPIGGRMCFGLADYANWSEISFARCPTCHAWWWFIGYGAYGCRRHRRHGWGDEDLGGLLRSGEPEFVQVSKSADASKSMTATFALKHRLW